MAYSLPQFNVPMDVWPAGQTPAGGPSAYQVNAQIYLWSRLTSPRNETVATEFVPSVAIRTTFHIQTNEANVVVKCILGAKDITGFWNYYIVKWYNWMHQGFANEYLFLLCDQCDDNGVTPDFRRG